MMTVCVACNSSYDLIKQGRNTGADSPLCWLSVHQKTFNLNHHFMVILAFPFPLSWFRFSGFLCFPQKT